MAQRTFSNIDKPFLWIKNGINTFTVSGVGNYTGLLCAVRVNNKGVCLFWCDTSPTNVTKTLIAGLQIAMDTITITSNGNGSFTFTTPAENTITGKILALTEQASIS